MVEYQMWALQSNADNDVIQVTMAIITVSDVVKTSQNDDLKISLLVFPLQELQLVD